MFLLVTNNNILPCSYLNRRRARQYIIISHPNGDDGAYVFYASCISYLLVELN